MPVSMADLFDPAEAARRVTQAGEAAAAGDRAGAVEHLRAAVRLDPFDEESRLLLASLLWEEERFAEAAGAAIEAIRIRPALPTAWNLLGVACLDALEDALAAQVLAHAVRLAPGFERARSNLSAARAALAKRSPRRTAPSGAFPRREVRDLLRGKDLIPLSVVLAGDGAEWAWVRDLAPSTEILSARTGDGATAHRAVRLPAPADARGEDDHHLNEAFRQARGFWILVLGTGESLDPRALASVKKCLRDRRLLAAALDVRGAGRGPTRAIRLFRNLPEVRTATPGLWDLPFSLLPLARRWGLRARLLPGLVVRDPAVPESLAGAVPDPLRPRPGDDWSEGALRAVRALATGSRDDCAEAARTCLEAMQPGGDPLLRRAACDALGEILASVASAARRREVAEALRRTGAGGPEAARLLGEEARLRGDAEEAAKDYRRALKALEAPRWTPVPPELREADLRVLVGSLDLAAGRLKAARREFAAADLKTTPAAGLGLLAVSAAEGDLEETLRILDTLAREHDGEAGILLQAAEVLERYAPLAPVRLAWLAQAVEAHPEHDVLARAHARALGDCGHWDEAAARWSASSPSGPEDEAARLVACWASGRSAGSLSGDPGDVSAELVRRLDRLWTAGAFEALDALLVTLRKDPAAPPVLVDAVAAWLEGRGQAEAARRLKPLPSGGPSEARV